MDGADLSSAHQQHLPPDSTSSIQTSSPAPGPGPGPYPTTPRTLRHPFSPLHSSVSTLPSAGAPGDLVSPVMPPSAPAPAPAPQSTSSSPTSPSLKTGGAGGFASSSGYSNQRRAQQQQPQHIDPTLQALDAGNAAAAAAVAATVVYEQQAQEHGQDQEPRVSSAGSPYARRGAGGKAGGSGKKWNGIGNGRVNHEGEVMVSPELSGAGQQQQYQFAGHAHAHGGQFGILTPSPNHAAIYEMESGGAVGQHASMDRVQQMIGDEQRYDLGPAFRSPVTPGEGGKKEPGGHFSGMKAIPNPPNLAEWRQRLFDLEETLTVTEDEFQTYFPHVDNIYSHRSTQRYKKKPFISHYWDCRLKGRPPGTPKSDDPNKRKRKRQARERDLCDVKIKITEYFPGARKIMESMGQELCDGALDISGGRHTGQSIANANATAFGSSSNLPGMNGERYFTISRVTGGKADGKKEAKDEAENNLYNNAEAESGAGDGALGKHKHTLEESDRIKKSSIQRQFLKEEKERKKQVQKTYHKRATGAALSTVNSHSKEHELKLYGSCFCPFVQRVWIALEHKRLAYQYIEVDPYKKPASLLALNPRGLVPALSNGPHFSCHESTVLLDYLEDAFPHHAHRPSSAAATNLLPPNAELRAYARLWADHVNRRVVPAFYRLLQAQEPAQQQSAATELKTELEGLLAAASADGPFFMGPELGWVDVQFAPWLLRLRLVLAPYRGWPAAADLFAGDPGLRWERWVQAVEAEPSVRATTSGEELYLDSYERYAENRPNTSQVADAVNAGRGLP